ncbi:MAG: membrane protein insertase YidC [Rickettsiales bacterium]|jgi:YidC/Oxa1 family membrane protein insertase|nr:membrane protein insertase YidC [Rickettsiales bacterium]
MKNINPEESKTRHRSFLETLALYTIFFLISEFFIVRPLMKRLVNRQIEKKQEIEKQNNSQNTADNFSEDGGTSSHEEQKYVVLENDYIRLVLNARGLLFNDLVLKKYTDAGENVRLLGPDEFVSVGWISSAGDTKIPNNSTLWTIENKPSAEDSANSNEITLSYDNGSSIKFKILLALDEKYLINVKQIVENNLDGKILLRPLWQIRKNDIKAKNRNDLFSFRGGLGVFDDKIYEVKTKKLKNNSKEFLKPRWAGITDKYWLVAIIGDSTDKEKVNFMGEENALELHYTTTKNMEISENSVASVDSKIFVGAKDLEILREYSNSKNIKLLDRSIDFGIFYFLAKPMNDLLNFLYKVTKNFGLSIIILTVIVKIILYPTVKKSFVTIALMKEVQPKIKILQNAYGSDSTKFREELVKLYKKYNLNPLASIVPIFIQIPIFFSLYKIISVSLNMRQAPLFWFIRDLSAADPSNILNFFGLLPYNTNFKIGLLPCIMAITMYFQQKLQSNLETTEKSGAKDKTRDILAENAGVAKFMPLIFLFMFASFPSGLLLYWIFNNIITIVQQYYVVNIYIKKHRKIYE